MAYSLHHQPVGARPGTDGARLDGRRMRIVRRRTRGKGQHRPDRFDCCRLAMMLYGAAGFYLGIDLPPVPPDHRMHLPLRHGLGSSWDTVELLSAAGTFLAAVAAVVSVSGIILDETARPSTALLISFGWAAGATVQIVAGMISRMRANASGTS